MELRRKTLHVASRPGRALVTPLAKRYHTHYKDQHTYPRIVFMLDLLVSGMAIGVLITLAILLVVNRNPLAKKIDFSADIAPTTVSSGSPSTLVLSWSNRSDEPLENATLTLTYPDHFLLQDLVYLNEHVETGVISLGTILPDNTGSIKIRGVMFGDVGGEQTFAAHLDFRHHNRKKNGSKDASFAFHPETSALTINAVIPDTIISEQLIEGTLQLANTGPIDFGQIAITPTDSVFDFKLTSKDATKTSQGIWTIPSLPSGTTKTITFEGRTPATDERTTHLWSFDGSFTFEDSTYLQGTTEHAFTLIPSPLTLEQSVTSPTLTPGGNLALTLNYSNRSDVTIRNLNLYIEAEAPLLAPRDGTKTAYNPTTREWNVLRVPTTLDPGEEGSVDVTIPLRTTLPSSGISSHEHLTALVRVRAEFLVPPENRLARLRTSSVSLPITSPVTLSSFGRYSTPAGDQIGRGPLPPAVGEETRYWIFWNVSGTTNELKDVEIHATLPPHVRLGDRKSASIGQSVSQNGNQIVWTLAELPTTATPGSQTIGVAFEVIAAPESSDAGRVMTLIDNVQLQATDAFTGAFVQAYGARVTTSLPNDRMAKGQGVVDAF